MPVAVEGQIDDGLRIGLNLGNDRLFHFPGQLPAHAADAVAHVARRVVGIAGQFKPDRNLALFGAADRGHDLDSLDPGERILERLAHLAFNDLGAGAQIAGPYRNHRLIDIGVFANRQLVVAHDPQQEQEDIHDGRKNRALDAKFRQGHGVSTFTAAPSCSFMKPAVTTCSSAASPLVISTPPCRRNPIPTFCKTARLSRTTKTKLSFPWGIIACSGITRALSWTEVTIFIRANMPG